MSRFPSLFGPVSFFALLPTDLQSNMLSQVWVLSKPKQADLQKRRHIFTTETEDLPAQDYV